MRTTRAAAFRALACGRLPAGTLDVGCPRLRFDRVAQRLVRNLRQVLADVPSAKTALVVTITAPIRMPGATVEELAGRAGKQLWRNFSAAVRGNQVRARIVPRRSSTAPRVIVFVHNPQPAPTRLFKLAAAVLSSPPAGTPAARRSRTTGRGRMPASRTSHR
jgi:hypothetical protein